LGLGWWRPGVAVGSGAFRDRGPGRTQAGQAVFVLWAESPRVYVAAPATCPGAL
jgi:hypothetical protein